MNISIEDAKAILTDCTRNELRDYAFGDKEVTFVNKGDIVAEGYEGTVGTYLTVFHDGSETSFTGVDALTLLHYGQLGVVSFNNSPTAAESEGGVFDDEDDFDDEDYEFFEDSDDEF